MKFSVIAQNIYSRQFFKIEILLCFIKSQGPWILILQLLYGGVPDGQPEGPLQGEPGDIDMPTCFENIYMRWSVDCKAPVSHVPEAVDVPGLLDMLEMPLVVHGHVLAVLAHHQPVYPAVAPHSLLHHLNVCLIAPIPVSLSTPTLPPQLSNVCLIQLFTKEILAKNTAQPDSPNPSQQLNCSYTSVMKCQNTQKTSAYCAFSHICPTCRH